MCISLITFFLITTPAASKMFILKIVAVTLISTLSTIECSVVAPAPLPAVPVYPAIRYTRVAPPSVLPFSAQVSTYTRNLHVFDAPYAAGVIPGPPPIVQRALLPAPVAPLHPAPFLPAPVAPLHPAPFPPAPVAPAPFLPAPVAPAPFIPAPLGPAPIIPAPNVAPIFPGVGPAGPVLPYAGQGPVWPYGGPAPVLPYAGAGVVPGWPYAGGLVGPEARSIHAVAPHVAPFVGHAPLLG